MDEALGDALAGYPEIGDYEALALGEDFALWRDADDLNEEGRCTERHLQCIWYSDALRPPLVTTEGERIEVESCGRWNLESGPDFIDAVFYVGEKRRRVAGDVEVHLRPSGWTSHGHGEDRRYEGVVLHLTYHDGPRPRDLPAGVLCAAMRPALLARRGFSFDTIDIARFPHADIPATKRPCGSIYGDSPDEALAALRAAGAYRLDLKRRRMQAALRATSDEPSVLYSFTMAALGYKNNASAFRQLASLYPLDIWQGDCIVDYARLLGLARMLPEMPSHVPAHQALVRRIWDAWWHNSLDLPEPPVVWNLSGLRPLNSPLRRLGAAAALFSNRNALLDAVKSADCSDPATPRNLKRMLLSLAGFSELEPVVSWATSPAHPTALIGDGTASMIVTNVLVPFMAAYHPRRTREIYSSLPPETSSQPMRLMALRLFGPDHNPRTLYEGSGLLQQGLIQIHNDFCLSCRADCADCAFAHRKSFCLPPI